MADRLPSDPRVSRFLAREVPRNVGDNAAWGVYDRSVRTPLNVVLDLAAERLGREPVLVWVDGGVPDAFSFTGLPTPVVVLCTRHLEIASALRNLSHDESLPGSRRDLSRRTTLAVVAELCLRLGKPRQAARCFLLSVVGQDLFIPHSDILDDLEAARFSEAYAAVWCFAVAHELGHHLPDPGLPDDVTLRGAVEESLRDISVVRQRPELLPALLEDLHADAMHPNRPSHLRAEVTADLFAAETIIHVADVLMRSHGEVPRSGLLYAEIVAAHAGISFIEWCRAMAAGLGQLDGDRAALRRLHTTAGFGVRQHFTRWYAESALGGLLPDGVDVSRWRAALDQLTEHLGANMAVVDSGVADAMRAAMTPSPTDEELLITVRADLRDGTRRALVGTHARTFLALAMSSPQRGATSLNGSSDPLLDAAVELLC